IVHLVAGQPILSATHDDEVIRRDNNRELPATARCAVCILRKIGEIIWNQPELSTIETAFISGSGRRSASKANPAFGYDPLAVPGASIQIQQAESREIAGVCVHLTT